MAKPAKAAPAAKPAAAAEDPSDEIQIDDGTGFTAEEEAALDSARAGPEKTTTAPTKPAAKAGPTPEERVKQLEKELADAKRNTVAERKRAEDAEKRKTTANANADAANDAAIAQAEGKLETDLAAAKDKVVQLNRELIAAYDSGESPKIAEVNERLLDAKITVTKLEDNKLGLTQYKEKFLKDREAAKKRAEAAPPNADTDVLTDEQVAQVYSGLPKTKAWIDEHPEFKTDIGFRQKAIRAHHAALGAGHDEETDEYFTFINEKMGLSEAAAEDQAVEDEALSEAAVEVRPAAPAKPKKPTPAAPPSRGATPTQASTGGRFKRLTAAEAEAANDSGMTHEEYYDSKHMPEPEFTAKYGYSNN